MTSDKRQLAARLKALRRALDAGKVDAALISDRANSFYFSGFPCSNSILFVTSENALFLTDFRYIERAEREISTLEVVRMTQDGSDELKNVIRKSGARTIAFESSISYGTFQRYRKAAGRAKLVENNALFTGIRAVKSPAEIEVIAQNQALNGKLFTQLIKAARPGMTEEQLRRRLIGVMLDRGVEEAFDTIIAAGENSSLPHTTAGPAKVRGGTYLLVDMGVKRRNYHSDMTRTVGVGRPGQKYRDVYHVVLEAQMKALDTIRAGVPCVTVDAAARDHIKAAGYGEFFGHGLGHGVGLEIHEAPTLNPRSRQVLQEGMVVTVEPGIYLPGFGGVRIEDLVVVTKAGYRNLTSVSKSFRLI